MRVFKGVFPKGFDQEMEGKVCIKVIFDGFVHISAHADNGDYAIHSSANLALIDEVELIPETEEIQTLESFKSDSPRGMFGQQMKSLSIEFK